MTSLLDRITRHQVYLESFKIGAIAAFNPYFRAMEDGIRRELSVVDVAHLDELTKIALGKLIGTLRGILRRQFNRYIKGMLEFLVKFARGERRIFEKVLDDSAPLDDQALWSRVLNTAIAANGQFVYDMMEALAANVESRMVDAVHKAYANSLAVSGLLGGLVGDGTELFGQSVLGRASIQNAALVETIVQHISSVILSTIAADKYDSYTWVSVIDRGTTDICRSRDGRVYKFGQGPIPPAHYRCRSELVPGEVENKPATFLSWARTQPEEIVADMLSPGAGKIVSTGKIKGTNFAAFANLSPLSLDDFLGKLPLILA